MNGTSLLVDRPAEGVQRLTLNRPECINALDGALCQALDDALAAAAEDEAVRCLLLCGAGERGFSAGYDVKELAQLSAGEMVTANLQRYEWMWRIAAHPKPLIVVNHGVCMGAGSIIAAAADLRLGTPDSIVRFTSTPHGAAMLTWLLPQLVGWSKAKEYLMMSCPVAADEALAHGLLNRIVAADCIAEAAVEMATTIASYEPGGPQGVKRLMRDGQGGGQREQMLAEMALLLQQQGGERDNQVGEWFSRIVNRGEEQ